jgi:hypothetical protein
LAGSTIFISITETALLSVRFLFSRRDEFHKKQTDSPKGLFNGGKYAAEWNPDQSLVHQMPNGIQGRSCGSHHGQRPGLLISWPASAVPDL